MKFVCEICGAEFTGENAERQCRAHELKHAKEDMPAIHSEPFVVEYDVLPKDASDYACCQLRNVKTGKYSLDGNVYAALSNTNIGNIEKLIGKRIRITSHTEIIGNADDK